MIRRKMSVLDMIIQTLQEHEKIIDALVQRLEAISPMLEKEMNQ